MKIVRFLSRRVLSIRPQKLLATLSIAAAVVTAQPASTFVAWQVGDVIVGVGDPWKVPIGSTRPTTGLMLRYSTPASAVQQLNEPANGFTTGCAFYPTATGGELWTTSFTSQVHLFDSGASKWWPTTKNRAQPWLDVLGQSNGYGESVAFAPDGSVFVATPYATGAQLHHYTHGDVPSNTLPTHIKSYGGLPGGGADWIDVAVEPNGDTVVYYTAEAIVERDKPTYAPGEYEARLDAGESAGVYRINITQTDATNTTVAEQVATLKDYKAWALRALPNRQGILVAGSNVIYWLGLDGHVVRTYAIPGALAFRALNIAPDGEYFWTATAPATDAGGRALETGKVYKVHIASGAVVRSIDTTQASVGGLCVVREYTAAFDACTADDGSAITCRRLEACTGATGDRNHDGFFNAADLDSEGNVLDDGDDDGFPDTADPDCAPPGSIEICGNSADDNHNGLFNETADSNQNGQLDASEICAASNMTVGVTGGVLIAGALGVGDTYSLAGLPASGSLAVDDQSRIWGTPGFADAGTYDVQVRVTRRDGSSSTGSYRILIATTFITNLPPTCSAAAPGKSILWPPDHKMVPITIEGVVDPEGKKVTTRITSIFQDEPTTTEGDADTAIDGGGIGTNTAQVRAERTGNASIPGDGRVYHIAFTATDPSGASCSGEVEVGVPHDQAVRDTPIDGGPLHDSLVPTTGPAAAVGATKPKGR